MAKVALNDDNLDKVVGGLMRFNYRTQIMTFTDAAGVSTTYPINDFDSAWERSNELHAKNYREETIVQDLIDNGYIG